MLGEEPIGELVSGVPSAFKSVKFATSSASCQWEVRRLASRWRRPASAVIIVKFHEPILVADGDDEVAVAGGIEDGVGMSPVWINVRTTVRVQMIEFVPGPNGLRCVIGIVAANIFHVTQIDDYVPCRRLYHRGGLRGAAMTITWPLGRTAKSWCVPITVTLHSAQVAAARAVLSCAAVICQMTFPPKIHLLHHGVHSVALSPMRN